MLPCQGHAQSKTLPARPARQLPWPIHPEACHGGIIQSLQSSMKTLPVKQAGPSPCTALQFGNLMQAGTTTVMTCPVLSCSFEILRKRRFCHVLIHKA